MVEIIKTYSASTSRLDAARQKELKDLFNSEGLQACLKNAGNNVEAITVCEGLDYNFWVGSAEIIGKKMKEGIRTDEFNYLGEKMRQLFYLAKTVTRFDDDKSTHERFDKAHDTLKELGF